jgi:two-component system sensor histidine kinase YcbA
MNRNWLGLVLMLLLIPMAGELKFYPFSGDFSSFRVSFGSPTFLFFLLWLRSTSFLYSGLLTGFSVLAFRITLDVFTSDVSFLDSLLLRFPAVFYYITYAAFFYFIKAKRFFNQPLRIALTAISAELAASMVELFFTLHSPDFGALFTLPMLSKIFLIAVIRNFFILGFVSIIYLRDAELAAQRQKEQNQHLLLLISDLYKEAIQLAKSLKNAENITRECYHLYETLHNNEQTLDKLCVEQTVLGIAGQIHEIKKDNQRIYASLTQLISERNILDYLPASELIAIIVESHKKYAALLGKEISFAVEVSENDLPPLHVYTVLSVINNLVANAVESIENSGKIKLAFSHNQDRVTFHIANNGPGIPVRKQELIFEPGYTTKFDTSGNPSTGMGLPYIKDLVHSLHGKITLESSMSEMKTVFAVELPLSKIIKRGD